uniref:G-protein coupled receptors family 1 profile domain-containing protein n=1 Tax=Panagrolaimus sp. PS1159 TaxID=55785 RepID=A0AC35GQ88_9BILA
MTWFGWNSNGIKLASSLIGSGLLCCWGATVYIQFIISVERFTAICYPVWFSRIFSARHTSAFILIAWIASALQIAAIGIFMQVYFHFDPSKFAYINTGDLKEVRSLGGAIFIGLLFIGMIIIDATSVISLRKRNNIQIRRLSKHRFNRRSTKSQRNIRRRRETILFFQSLITCLILMIQQILFHLSSNFTNPWLNALTNVCPTLVLHSTNGYAATKL